MTRGGKQQTELRGYDYYNAEDSFLKWYIDYLKAFWKRPGNPINVIVIAHMLEHENKNIMTNITVKTRRIVTAGKAIGAYIPAQFDDVYVFGTREIGGASVQDPISRIHHLMTTVTQGEDDAKTAFNLARETDFTDGSLYDKLLSQIAGSEMML